MCDVCDVCCVCAVSDVNITFTSHTTHTTHTQHTHTTKKKRKREKKKKIRSKALARATSQLSEFLGLRIEQPSLRGLDQPSVLSEVGDFVDLQT